MKTARVAHAIGNIFGIVLFVFFFMAALKSYQQSHSLLTFGIVAVNGLMLSLYTLRRRHNAIIAFPFAWVLGFTGTVMPLLFRPSQTLVLPWLSEPGHYVQIVGLVAICGALLSLNRSLGIVAANRGIQVGGCYRVVRHPLYASELLFFCGFALSNQSLANLLVFMLIFAVQYCRLRIEENFLGADPAYVQYMSKTRYRLIPGVL
jgi:protein-S-isoprenylcysteine O-methyltransferase Ste14